MSYINNNENSSTHFLNTADEKGLVIHMKQNYFVKFCKKFSSSIGTIQLLNLYKEALTLNYHYGRSCM